MRKETKWRFTNKRGSTPDSAAIAAFLDNMANVEEYIERKPISIRTPAHTQSVASEFLSKRKFIITRPFPEL